MLKTGDIPGKGTYKCLKCGKIVTLENDTDALPVCPKMRQQNLDEGSIASTPNSMQKRPVQVCLEQGAFYIL